LVHDLLLQPRTPPLVISIFCLRERRTEESWRWTRNPTTLNNMAALSRRNGWKRLELKQSTSLCNTLIRTAYANDHATPLKEWIQVSDVKYLPLK